ncbi:uncharacterized protein LOC142558362 [Dermacentor variabilis]|uniref:uncharacterized protein LOC142558362 n=1 Tax=Dermacentor variabilis TaxID=34621 RepID=UPI003F5C9667
MAVTTVADIEPLAEAKMEEGVRTYIALRAGDGLTLRENIEAFKRLRFRPRILVDVEKVNTRTTVLGREVSFPVGLAPSATHKLVNPEGEIGCAQGVAVRINKLAFSVTARSRKFDEMGSGFIA